MPIHVPYRGSTPAVTDLVGGQVSIMIDTVPFNLAQRPRRQVARAGRRGRARCRGLPDVPTMAEAGVPDVEGGLWLALFAPAQTPPAVVAYLNKQAQEIFALPDVRQRDGAARPGAAVAARRRISAISCRRGHRWRDVITRAKIEFPH